MNIPPLDPPTLLISTAMLGYLLAVTCLSASLSMASFRPALATWSKSLACGATAFILYWLRGSIPWWASFVLANVLVLGFPAFGHLAYAQLLDVTTESNKTAASVLVALTGVFAVAVFGLDPGVAVVTLSLGITALLGRTAWMVLRTSRARSQPVTVLGQGATMLLAFAFAVRGLVALLGDGGVVSPAAPSSVQVAALLVGAAFVAMASLGFIALTHHLQQHLDLESSRRDGLTGVLTRRAFLERADELLSAKPQQGYAVVMADLDHFKAVNDTYGHMGGDLVLAHAARLISSTVRMTDIVGRYGGEEFVVVLPGCSLQDAAKLSTRVVELAHGQTVRLPDERQVKFTVSMGYSACASGNLPLSVVLEQADQALYAAKRQGRNQAMAAVSPLASPA